MCTALCVQPFRCQTHSLSYIMILKSPLSPKTLSYPFFAHFSFAIRNSAEIDSSVEVSGSPAEYTASICEGDEEGTSHGLALSPVVRVMPRWNTLGCVPSPFIGYSAEALHTYARLAYTPQQSMPRRELSPPSPRRRSSSEQCPLASSRAGALSRQFSGWCPLSLQFSNWRSSPG